MGPGARSRFFLLLALVHTRDSTHGRRKEGACWCAMHFARSERLSGRWARVVGAQLDHPHLVCPSRAPRTRFRSLCNRNRRLRNPPPTRRAVPLPGRRSLAGGRLVERGAEGVAAQPRLCLRCDRHHGLWYLQHLPHEGGASAALDARAHALYPFARRRPPAAPSLTPPPLPASRFPRALFCSTDRRFRLGGSRRRRGHGTSRASRGISSEEVL